MFSQTFVVIAFAVFSAQASYIQNAVSSCSPYESYGNAEPISDGYAGAQCQLNYQPRCDVEPEVSYNGGYSSCADNIAPYDAVPSSCNAVPYQSSWNVPTSSCNSLPYSGSIGAPPSPQPRVLDTSCVCTKTVLKNQPVRRLIVVKSVQRYLKTSYRPVVEKVPYNASPNCDNCEREYSSEPVISSYPRCDDTLNSQAISVGAPLSGDVSAYPESCGAPEYLQSVGIAGYSNC